MTIHPLDFDRLDYIFLHHFGNQESCTCNYVLPYEFFVSTMFGLYNIISMFWSLFSGQPVGCRDVPFD